MYGEHYIAFKERQVRKEQFTTLVSTLSLDDIYLLLDILNKKEKELSEQEDYHRRFIRDELQRAKYPA